MYSKYEHIRQLYIEKISGVISVHDEAMLQKMLEEDSECREMWAALLEEGGSIKASSVLENISVESELKKLKDRTLPERKQSSVIKWVSVAAAVTIIFGLTFILLRNDGKTERQQLTAGLKKGNMQVRLLLNNGMMVNLDSLNSLGTITAGKMRLHASANSLESITGGDAAALNMLIVPSSADYTITLADGTMIVLNSDSRLRFPSKFSGRQREVYLDGEAYFKVVHDAEHPFIVHTDLTNVQVLGTSFNLNTYEKGMVTTSLLTGSVLVTASAGDKVRLTPGLESEFASGRGFVTRDFDSDDVLSWMKGVYYFHNMPLSDLRPIIKRWFGTDLVFDDEGLGEKRISGLIEKNRLDEFLKDLRSSAHFGFYQEGNTLHLTE